MPEHVTHLDAPCAGHAAPTAAVPPLAHAHCFVAQTRFCDALGATASYSSLPHAVHATHAPYPVLSEYVPGGQAVHCAACCSLLASEPKLDPCPAGHDAWSAQAELSLPRLYLRSAALHCSQEAVPDTMPKPVWHVAHVAVLCVGHAAPAAASPLVQVHCFVAHCRFCVLLGATVWYSALLHVVHAAHASLLS